MLVFWGGDVGQSAAAGGNAGYFKLTPTLLLYNFFLPFLLLAHNFSPSLLWSHFFCLTHPRPEKPTYTTI